VPFIEHQSTVNDQLVFSASGQQNDRPISASEKCGKTWVVCLFVFCFYPVGIFANDCSDMEQTIADESVRDYLINWVDEHIRGSYEFAKAYQGGKRITSLYSVNPGRYSLVEEDINWDMLGPNDHRSRVVVLGVDPRDMVEHNGIVSAEMFSSIYFSLKINRGFMVKTKAGTQFTDEAENPFLKVISDRVAVYCKVSRGAD
jgi:hypothetical protein